MLGIGIITYKRPHALAVLLCGLKSATSGEYCLVVADDGSGDETERLCHDSKVPIVTGTNRGVAWNKNRALHWLYGSGCTHFLLIEDDGCVVEMEWDRNWIRAIERWDHVNWMDAEHVPQLNQQMFFGGSGTLEDPYICEQLYGFCMGFSLRSLKTVGFFDTRYRGYGFEHLDLSSRNRRAGFGVLPVSHNQSQRSFVMIRGGLRMLGMPSHSDVEAVELNRSVYEALREAPVYRPPWRNRVERDILESETGHRIPSLGPPQ